MFSRTVNHELDGDGLGGGDSSGRREKQPQDGYDQPHIDQVEHRGRASPELGLGRSWLTDPSTRKNPARPDAAKPMLTMNRHRKRGVQLDINTPS